jgi:FkbM family methyltransferase
MRIKQRRAYWKGYLRLSYVSILMRADRVSALRVLRSRIGDNSVWHGLNVLFSLGFRPNGILDIGAYHGEWALTASQLFPESRVLMVEAQPDLEPILRAVASTNPARFDYRIALLGANTREAVDFYQIGGDVSTGSSIFEEQTTARRTRLSLPMRRLGDLTTEVVRGKYQLLKLDVQGAELQVLRGSGSLLDDIEVVVMESSLAEYNRGAPLFSEMLEAMSEFGFRIFDVFPLARRRGILLQVDAIFLREESDLWPRPPF